MPRLQQAVPKYRRHRASGQAVVSIQGRVFYLGPWNSKASKIEYDRIINEWITAGRQLPSTGLLATDLTVVEVLARFKDFAIGYYRKNGKSTGEWENIRAAIEPVAKFYGRTPVGKFGPLALKAVRQAMIDAGLCRNVINGRIARIKRVFKWAASEELVPAELVTGLATVAGLEAGRSGARETKKVKRVADDLVRKTLPHMPKVVADMVRLQRLCGCRPCEVTMIRPCDVDVSGDVWIYCPQSHKTEHYGLERWIPIGPQGQEILAPYLIREPTSYCFSPAESERQRKETMRAARKSKVQPSQICRSRHRPKKKPGAKYTTASYGYAIRRACERAGVELWSPNRLRHAAATDFRNKYGMDATQAILGHTNPKTTERYAERNRPLAIEVMRKLG